MLDVQKSLALQVSVRTGLKEDTCLDLILSGWTFNQRNNSEPDRWISPMGSLTIPKK
ncbi:hypothetical protein SEA_GIANTSBANE_51 [Arthrobacter phage Giantsbane]|nr:hypothetical protein SEA_GIANTSBANE_51 [Arthrobacter phage Giantsbane]